MTDKPDMSESEKYAAQGRALKALKDAKSNAATIRTVLAEYARQLRDVGQLLQEFSADPTKKSASLIPLGEHLKRQIEVLESKGTETARLIDELRQETAHIAELQAQIDDF